MSYLDSNAASCNVCLADWHAEKNLKLHEAKLMARLTNIVRNERIQSSMKELYSCWLSVD